MMDEREDRFDAVLREAAKEYNAPPVTPKAEMWDRIAAERRSGGQAVRRSEDNVIPIRRPVRTPFRIALGIAALLALGVAIGRVTAPRVPGVTPAASPSTMAAVPGAPRNDRAEVAAGLATVEHLDRADAFLTEFNLHQAAQEFVPRARELLGTTRLLLDSKRLTDPATRKLLEDLELVLTQISTLDPKDRSEDLGFIKDGLAQNHLRSRLKNVTAVPAIRM
jgi:hypothetical protein